MATTEELDHQEMNENDQVDQLLNDAFSHGSLID